MKVQLYESPVAVMLRVEELKNRVLTTPNPWYSWEYEKIETTSEDRIVVLEKEYVSPPKATAPTNVPSRFKTKAAIPRRRITAKFPGSCGGCGRKFPAGEKLARFEAEGMWVASCCN